MIPLPSGAKKKRGRPEERPNIFLVRSGLLTSPVLVGVDAAAEMIGLAVELALVLLGQMAIVLRHVTLLVVLKALFAFFKPRGLSGVESS